MSAGDAGDAPPPFAVEPPFQTPSQAGAFALLLGLLLVLPVAFGTSGVFTREQAYASAPEAWGSFSYIHHEIFEETADIDLLLIATSQLYQGIDGVQLQQQLSAHLGRPATVVTLSTNWRSAALDYQLLRDVLARRTVRMVLTSSPSFTMGDSLPHLQSHRWMLYGTDDGDLEGLGWRDRLTFHAQTVLGLPRQLLSLLRANRTDPSAWAGTYGTLKVTRGIGRQPFRPYAPPPPSLDPAALTFRPGAADFVVEHDPLPAYQTHYFAKFFAVARQAAVPVVLLHVPLWVERHDTVVRERLDWSRTFDGPLTLLGVPPSRLFAGMTDADVDALFYNDDAWPNHHFNSNGSTFFTAAITPALLATYDHLVTP